MRIDQLRSLQAELSGIVAKSGESVSQHGQSAPLAVPQLASCASSGRGRRLWAAWHFENEADPLGAQPLLGLELAAFEATDFTAFDHLGVRHGRRACGRAAAAAAEAAARRGGCLDAHAPHGAVDLPR